MCDGIRDIQTHTPKMKRNVWTDQMKHDKFVYCGCWQQERSVYLASYAAVLVMHVPFSLQAHCKKIIEEILGKQSFEVKPFIDAVSIAKARFDSLTHLLL